MNRGVEGGRGRGKPRRGWMAGVVSALSMKRWALEQARVSD